jgi:hypothetical protein
MRLMGNYRNPLVDYDALAAYASLEGGSSNYQQPPRKLTPQELRVKAEADAREKARYLADPVRRKAEANARELLSTLPGSSKEKEQAVTTFTALLQGKTDVAAMQHLGTTLGKKALAKYSEKYGKPALKSLLGSVPVHFPGNIPVNEAVWAVGYQILSGHFDPEALAKAALKQGEKYVLAEGQRIAIEEGTKLAGSFAANVTPFIGPAIQVFTGGNPFKGADPKGVINCFVVTWGDVFQKQGEAYYPKGNYPAGAQGVMYAGRLRLRNDGLPDPRFHIIGGTLGFKEVEGAWGKEGKAAASFLKAFCKDNPYMKLANVGLTMVGSIAGGPIAVVVTGIYTVIEGFSKTISEGSSSFKHKVAEGKKKAVDATIKYLKDSGEWRRIVTAREEAIKTNDLAVGLSTPVRLTFHRGGAKTWPSPEPVVYGWTVADAIRKVVPKPGQFSASTDISLYGHPFTIEHFVEGKWKKISCGPFETEQQYGNAWKKCGAPPKTVGNGSYTAVYEMLKKEGLYEQDVLENPGKAAKLRASVIASIIKKEVDEKKKHEAFVQSDRTRMDKKQHAEGSVEQKRISAAAPTADKNAAAKFAGKNLSKTAREALLRQTRSDLKNVYFACSDRTTCPEADKVLAEIRWLENSLKAPSAKHEPPKHETKAAPKATPPVKRQEQKLDKLKKEIADLQRKADAARRARDIALRAVQNKDAQRQQAVAAGLNPAQAAAATAPLQQQTAAAVSQAVSAAASVKTQQAQVQQAAAAAQVPMQAVQRVMAMQAPARPAAPFQPFWQSSFTSSPLRPQTGAAAPVEPAQPAIPSGRPDLFSFFFRR